MDQLIAYLRIRFHRCEEGVIVPLTIIILMGLLAAVTHLALRPTYARVAQVTVFEQLDGLCRQLAKRPTFQAQAWSDFRNGVDAIDVSGGYISHARMVLPVIQPGIGGVTWTPAMTTNETCGTYVDNDGATQSRQCYFVPDPSVTSPPGVADLGRLRYPIPTAWSGSVFLGPEDAGDQFPQAAGNTVLCEARVVLTNAGILRVFQGNVSEVFVRSGWWSRPGNWDPQDDFKIDMSGIPGDHPWSTRGLTLVVAPHMTTPAAHNTDGVALFDITDDTFLESGDELSAAFKARYGVLHGNRDWTDGFSGGYDARLFEAGSGISDLHLPDIPGMNADDLTEMLLACYGLPVIVRNLFLATLVELAARDGFYNNSRAGQSATSVYIAGTQDRTLWTQDLAAVGDDGVQTNNLPHTGSPPIRIVARGAGFTQRTLQHPWMVHYSGVRHGTTPTATFATRFNPPGPFQRAGIVGRRLYRTSGDLALQDRTLTDTEFTDYGGYVGQGWSLPFAFYNGSNYVPHKDYLNLDDDGLSAAKQMAALQSRSLQAGALRYCFNIFTDGGGTGVAMDVDYHVNGMGDSSDLRYDYPDYNSGFEPGSGSGLRRDDSVTGRPTGDGSGAYLRSSWSGSEGKWDAQTGDGNLNLYEFMKTMGSVQACPTEMTSLNLPEELFLKEDGTLTDEPDVGGFGANTGSAGRCWKPFGPCSTHLNDGASYDLRPDLAAALDAINMNEYTSGSGQVASARSYVPSMSGSADALAGGISMNFPSGNGMAAINSPGLFRPRSDYGFFDTLEGADTAIDENHRLYASGSYSTPVADDSSTVVIFTHQPISHNDVYEIHNRVAQLNDGFEVGAVSKAPRGVVIVYMPIFIQDATENVISRFARALGIASSQTAPPITDAVWDGAKNGLNGLIVLTPYSQLYIDETGTSVYDDGGNTSCYKDFKRYWTHLLHRDPSQVNGNLRYNVIDLAQTMYYKYISRVEAKY